MPAEVDQDKFRVLSRSGILPKYTTYNLQCTAQVLPQRKKPVQANKPASYISPRLLVRARAQQPQVLPRSRASQMRELLGVCSKDLDHNACPYLLCQSMPKSHTETEKEQGFGNQEALLDFLLQTETLQTLVSVYRKLIQYPCIYRKQILNTVPHRS